MMPPSWCSTRYGHVNYQHALAHINIIHMPLAILAHTLIQAFPCRYAKAQVGPGRGINQSVPGARGKNFKIRGTGGPNVLPNEIHGPAADRAVRRTERARPGSNIHVNPSWPIFSSADIPATMANSRPKPGSDRTGLAEQLSRSQTKLATCRAKHGKRKSKLARRDRQ